jgi:hypothetical protein
MAKLLPQRAVSAARLLFLLAIGSIGLRGHFRFDDVK